MKINFLNLVLVLLVTVTGFHLTFGQKCKIGEPKPLEVEPDLNITVSPVAGQVGEQLQITCDAGLPRFPLPPLTRPFPATIIIISHDGIPANALKTCQDTSGITQCTFALTLAENTTKVVVCQAKNSGGECRIKTKSIDILKKIVSSTMDLQTDKSLTLPPSTPSVVSSSTPSLPNGGSSKDSSEDDDEELDIVKRLVIATLVLVVMMTVLLLVALFYILHLFKN